LSNGEVIRFGDVLVFYRESASAQPTVTRASRADVMFEDG
jgi:hypothetical protein